MTVCLYLVLHLKYQKKLTMPFGTSLHLLRITVREDQGSGILFSESVKGVIGLRVHTLLSHRPHYGNKFWSADRTVNLLHSGFLL